VLYRVRNEKAREFIALCIHQDPRSRPSVEELLNHVFLRQHDEDDEEVRGHKTPPCLLQPYSLSIRPSCTRRSLRFLCLGSDFALSISICRR
jgi:serine/threonine protein kinase